MTLPHISNSEHQTQMPIPLADHCIPREQQRLRSLSGPRHLREDNTSKIRLNHNPDNTLEAHQENSFGTLLSDHSATVTNRVLRFYAVQEARGEVVDVYDTRREIFFILVRR